MTRAELEWDTLLVRYASTVDLGGTAEERKWAWARANDALDRLMLEELQAMRAKAKATTEELKAAA
jgi:hypothetical protein